MDDPYHWDDPVDAWEEVAESPAFVTLREVICARAQPQPDDVVVDLGAGTGLIALALAPRVAAVAAVDISAKMLPRLERHADSAGICNVQTVEADLRTLPFEDESITRAVSNYTRIHRRRARVAPERSWACSRDAAADDSRTAVSGVAAGAAHSRTADVVQVPTCPANPRRFGRGSSRRRSRAWRSSASQKAAEMSSARWRAMCRADDR